MINFAHMAIHKLYRSPANQPHQRYSVRRLTRSSALLKASSASPSCFRLSWATDPSSVIDFSASTGSPQCRRNRTQIQVLRYLSPQALIPLSLRAPCPSDSISLTSLVRLRFRPLGGPRTVLHAAGLPFHLSQVLFLERCLKFSATLTSRL